MNKRTAAATLAVTLACASALAAGPSAAGAAGVVISPLPGTVTATPQTQISFLGAGASSLGGIYVAGSSSGRHRGRLRSYASTIGASFLPSTPFAPGERVTVRARWHYAKGKTRTLSDSFTVAAPAAIPLVEFSAAPGKPSESQSFISEPALHPPFVTVSHPASSASAPGDLFASPFLGPGQYGPMIFDNNGNLVWFRPLPAGEDAADFRTQTYQGKTVLTWWQGKTYTLGFGQGVDIIANANYKTIAEIKAGNGLAADEHEFLLTPHGSAFVLAYNPVQTSLASAGGPASGIALDGVIQEIDVRTGLVMWEWHSLGHVDVSESYSKAPTTPTAVYDYFHVNSLDVDRNGNVLISARNTWTLYDINAHNGAITWRLGGKQSTFTLGPGVQFAYQHDAVWMPNSEISLFDDEGAPPVKPPSRGEIVKLDTKAKTVTLVAQFGHAPGGLVSGSQGDVQSLPGGRYMVGWGGLPNFTEFDSAGEVIFDAQLPNVAPMGEFSYRVYREVWSGQPSEPPAAVARSSRGATAVYASWNGATDVASWQLLTGSSAAHMSVSSVTPDSGFQTTIPAPVAALYQVRALSASGSVLGTSATVAATAG
jgi:Arylsulfotransferase (ASST)